MNNTIQGGTTANKNGKIFENILIPAFEKNGYIIIKESSKNLHDLLEKNDKVVIQNAKYTSIYGHEGRTEFVLVNKPKDKRIRIECKWQQSPGSVDEKFPYLYLNCVFSFQENEVIILLEGNGYKKGSYEWVKNAITQKWLNVENKKISLMNIAEFLVFLNTL